ncbi:minichromosome maintenance (MCM) complex subunit [Perkinsela sp. CCAP 1560/4]|nr:minichromosome maintenance (MCM) complex subunit [Perkinsela sp. CCAP 1560/4]|eukprot:KNH07211.1 minichromosome maintenance (MCM) complex subunit [Perkinsela sp. CCAP 1560/4]
MRFPNDDLVEDDHALRSQSDEEEPEGDDLFADHILAEDYASEDRSSENDSELGDVIANDEDSNSSVADYFKHALQLRLDEEKRAMKHFRIRDASVSSGSHSSDEHEIENPKPVLTRPSKKPKLEKTPISAPQNLFSQSEGFLHVLTSRNNLDGAEGVLDENLADANDDLFDWTNNQCDLSEWIQEKRVKAKFISAIKAILWNYQIGNTYVYRQKIMQVVRDNKQSLEMHFLHLCNYRDQVIGRWLADIPQEIIPLLDEAASEVMKEMFPRYASQQPGMYVRITGLSIKDSIRNLRSVQLRSLINIDGVIVRRSSVFKQLFSLSFDCSSCGFLIGPLSQAGPKEVRPMACTRCHFKGPFKLNILHSNYRSHQIMVLQESPSSVPPGRLPRTIELHLTNDLVDSAKPGDNVDVVGVFCSSYDPLLHDKQGFPVFLTTMEVNNISLQHLEGHNEVLDDDYKKIRELSGHPLIKEKLLRSVAPSMHGHDDVKLGLLLSLLGGVTKHHTGHRIRGDINVLLLGDPGMGKSQFLKWVERAAQRAVFTTGKGSSAVGLTAAVRKDAVSGEYVLEGGAMVIADRGVCLIDEFDKMNDTDRTSIHEAMEQQTISIARAGIVTTLSAQCTVIAAANPIGGRYDRSSSLGDNVHLTKPILSRFDLVHIITDDSTPESDLLLAKFVTASHRESHPEFARERLQKKLNAELMGEFQSEKDATDDTAPNDSDLKHVAIEDDNPASSLPLYAPLFKKYIQYARLYCKPKITQQGPERLPQLFAELRQETAITVRELESIIRLAEAHARIRLREYVKEDDFNEAIALFLRCYLKRHRLSDQKHLYHKFKSYLSIDDDRLIALIENRLEEVIRNELALHNTEKEVVISFKSFAEKIDNDSIPSPTLYKILHSRKRLLGGKVTLKDGNLIFKIKNQKSSK